MFCSKCGNPLADNSIFCTFCGERIDGLNPASVPVPVFEKPISEEAADIAPSAPESEAAPEATFDTTPEAAFDTTPKPTFDTTPQPTFDTTPKPTFDTTPKATFDTALAAESSEEKTAFSRQPGEPAADVPRTIPAAQQREFKTEAPSSAPQPAVPVVPTQPPKPEKYYTFGHIAMCLAAVAVMAIVAGVFAGLYFSVV